MAALIGNPIAQGERVVVVRVVTIEHGIVILKVPEGIIHCATVATLLNMTACVYVALRFNYVTVDKLLLRETKKFSVSNKVGTLEGTNCGKGPA